MLGNRSKDEIAFRGGMFINSWCDYKINEIHLFCGVILSKRLWSLFFDIHMN